MALTGSVVGNVCYVSASMATDAYYSAIVPVTLADGSLVSYQKPWGYWDKVVTSPAGATTYTSMPALSFPSCDPILGFSDGLLFAAMIVVLIFAASSFGIIARAR